MSVAVNGYLGARVESFIDRHLRSVAELEVLLLLGKHGPSSRREVARRLAFEPAMLEQSVKGLVRQMLVEDADGRLALASGDAALADMVDELALAYRVRRTAVVARIYRERDLRR